MDKILVLCILAIVIFGLLLLERRNCKKRECFRRDSRRTWGRLYRPRHYSGPWYYSDPTWSYPWWWYNPAYSFEVDIPNLNEEDYLKWGRCFEKYKKTIDLSEGTKKKEAEDELVKCIR